MFDPSGLVSGFFGVGTSLLSNKLAEEREKLAREENYRYGEMAAQNADARTRALYSDLYSPQALMQQIKEAGLSPSLFYGQAGGVSGQSGAQGTGAAGISPTTYGINPLEYAQIENLKAQTEKTKEEAKVVESQAEADIAQKLSEAGYKEAATKFTEAQTKGQELNNYVNEATKGFSINKANALAEIAGTEAQKAIYDLIISANNAEISSETMQAQIAETFKKVELLDAQILVDKSLQKLNQAQRAKCYAEITKWQEEVQQGWQKVAIDLQNANTQKERNSIMEKYQNEMVENLNNRLSFDKNVFEKEYGMTKWKFIYTIWNDQTSKFMGALGKAVSGQ